jgi:type II secretory pathway pseudopilin PulG
MNCVSNNHPGPRRPATGFSLLELTVAMTVTMIFFGAVYLTFVQVSKGHKAAEARMDAMRNGRAALATLGAELKSRLITNGGNIFFQGRHFVASYGDGVDNDGDGRIDEEEVNGVLDSPTSGTLADLQRRAKLTNYIERPAQVTTVTLGDAQIDVDAKFGRNILVFNVSPKVTSVTLKFQQITYAVTKFEGEDNVLVRQVENVYNNGNPNTVSTSPLAFKVAGFDLLFWDPNVSAINQKWLIDWDSTSSAPLQLPASIYIRLTMLADPRPAETLVPGQPMDVIPLETIVNIEKIIDSPEYNAERPSLL